MLFKNFLNICYCHTLFSEIQNLDYGLHILPLFYKSYIEKFHSLTSTAISENFEYKIININKKYKFKISFFLFFFLSYFLYFFITWLNVFLKV